MPFIQARAKFTNGNGNVVTHDSNILNVLLSDMTQDPSWGTEGYKDLTVEYQAGYAGRNCCFVFSSREMGEVARLRDILITDPNGAVTVAETSTTSTGAVRIVIKVTSTGRDGLVSFSVPAKFDYLMVWDDERIISGTGYSALKGFRAFGNTLAHIEIGITGYNFYVPSLLPTTLKSIKFTAANSNTAANYFNHPNVQEWDVRNLLATSFAGMFANCTAFNQDLSGWCVSHVTSPPANFSVGSALTQANHPVWGTCPGRGTMGNWDYGEFVLELNSGHNGQQILVYFQNSTTGEYAHFNNFLFTDPNNVASKAAWSSSESIGSLLTSNGKAGMVAVRCYGNYDTVHVWSWVADSGLVKRIASFGSAVSHVRSSIAGYNYDAPDNILPNIKSVKFALATLPTNFNSAKVVNWTVSYLTDMTGMFLNCVDFNQDLSKWCVSHITSLPANFSLYSKLTAANHPVWGTCPGRAAMGEWDYEDLTLEYQTGYTGRSCTVFFATADSQTAQVADITINDPNGVLTVTNTTTSTGKALKFASTGKAGLVSIRLPARFTTFVIWDDTGLVNGNGYPALKGFRSFGNTLRDVILGLIPYNYQVPTNIPATLKTIRFNMNSIVASTRFNDPNISGWNVSKLDPSSFNEMLMDCWAFNQDLSGWCVSQVTSPPSNFATRSALAQAYHPVWGTCPSTITLSGYSIGNKAGRANNNHIDVFDNIGADDWIYISYTLSAVKAGDVVAWKTPAGSYLNSNGQVDRATIYQLPEQASVNGTNSIVFNKAASSAIVTWRMDEAFEQSVATKTEHVILYINGVERLRLNVTVLGQR